MKVKQAYLVMVGAAALLLIPLLLMKLQVQIPDSGSGSDGLKWSGSDFVLAWVLLTGIGMGLVMALKKSGSKTFRIGGAVVIFATLWLWVELAVGLFTNWGS